MEEGNESTRSLQQRIASLVIDTFEKLPNKCKPQRNEWTCLAAIVASSNINNELQRRHSQNSLEKHNTSGNTK